MSKSAFADDVDQLGCDEDLPSTLKFPSPESTGAARGARNEVMYALGSTVLRWNYALTIFISAFLLFQVQPILGRFILPWFGGTPAVWTTCLVFFQTVLLAGYAYAHASQHWLSSRTQGALHLVLLVVAAVTLSIAPDASWKPDGAEFPMWRILGLLTVSVGLPYFTLSATGPLLQAWFSRAYQGRSPYRLYALSNVGSLLALLSYPFFFERVMRLHEQTDFWSIGYWAFAGLCGVLALSRLFAREEELATSAASASVSHENHASATAAPTLGRRLAWLALPALASVMLLATTNHVSQDVAPIPLLWVLPLSLYLLTFIISFDHERWYRRRLIGAAAVAALCLAATVDQFVPLGIDLPTGFIGELTLYLAAMFLMCMVCHGELVRLKPSAKYLTSFYLMISAGGALGGLFVSLVAPFLFSTYFEWTLSLVIGGLLSALAVLNYEKRAARRVLLFGVPLLAVIFVGIKILPRYLEGAAPPLDVYRRSFYGIVRVKEFDRNNPELHRRAIVSGRIVHGQQFADAAKRGTANSYYGPQSGAGKAFEFIGKRPDAHYGVVGLGAGTVALFAKPGQSIRFYEINPQMKEMAEEYFTYIKDCQGKLDIVMGDGRLSLEREPQQNFDLLLLDAFSGDAVPTHLLTKEAFEIYLKHMKPDGVIAVNVSNLYLDLVPVVAALAKEFGLQALHFDSKRDNSVGILPAEWVLLTKNQELIDLYPEAAQEMEQRAGDLQLWTDDHSNLFGILK